MAFGTTPSLQMSSDADAAIVSGEAKGPAAVASANPVDAGMWAAITGVPEQAAADVQDSHETLWASMKTVVVQDLSPSRDAKSQAPALQDSPASSCSSSSTSSSDGDTPRRLVEVAPADRSDAMGMGESVPLDFQDLFGDGEEYAELATMAMPSVQDAQKHLDHILDMRTKIKAISAKYSAPASSDAVLVADVAEGTQPKNAEEDAVPADRSAAQGISAQKDQLPTAYTTLPGGTSVAFTPPVRPRFAGPSARPDSADIANVMEQLGTSLRQFKAAGTESQPEGVSAGGPSAHPSAAVCDMPTTIVDAGGLGDDCSAGFTAICESTAALASDAGDCSVGFTIGGKKGASPASMPADCEVAPAAVLARPADAATLTRRPFAVDEAKLRASTELEAGLKEEMWQSFLAGDDAPVGGDGLPPPEMYFGKLPA